MLKKKLRKKKRVQIWLQAIDMFTYPVIFFSSLKFLDFGEKNMIYRNFLQVKLTFTTSAFACFSIFSSYSKDKKNSKNI